MRSQSITAGLTYQVCIMDNPFQIISEAFQPEYRVNLSIQRLDGSIMLTLSNKTGVVAKRMISALQRNDPKRLLRLIESIRFGIAIEQGHSAMRLLAAMTDRDNLKPVGPASKSWRAAEPGLVNGL
jgi:hypothetical protein